jgi:hypothetical protein
MAIVIKTLSLTLDAKTVECQLDQAELTDNPDTEDIETFCGTESTSTPKYSLTLGGFQDWGAVDAVCDMLHTAYLDKVDNSDTDPAAGEIAFVLTVGKKTRTGVCKPIADPGFGGQAGSPLKFSVELDVIGRPTDGTVV